MNGRASSLARWLPCLAIATASLATGCRRDPCAIDGYESNEDFDEATDLGDFTDQETTVNLPLTLDSRDDTDVFFFNVRDEGIDGNPEVEIWLEGQDNEQLEMTLEYQCTSDVMLEFNCNGEEVQSSRGRACRVAGPDELYIDLTYDCAGSALDDTDSGFAVLTITRTNPPADCAAYDLEIHTD
ncbi:MAG: hypothetical protein HOW73_45155 [Polyangiaceae bacterium]|nr:hypothetical protein [Polyangiaceae bacterium]